MNEHERPVLLVEDDPMIAELEGLALSLASVSYVRTSRVAEAIERLQQQTFLAVLLDYSLPDGLPWPVLQAAQALRPRVPVILVTAMGDERLAAEAIHRGVADYIRKDDLFWERLPHVVRSVAARAAADERARRAEALYDLLTEHSADIISVLAPNGSVKDISRGCKLILGYEPEELIGRDSASFLMPEDQERSLSVRARETGDARLDSTFRFRHKDGRWIWLESRGFVVRHPDTNAVLEIVSMARDITKRRETEERLRHREASLAEAQELAHLGSWEWDQSTNVVTWSDELFRIYGLDKDGFVPSPSSYLSRVHPGDRARVDDLVRSAIVARGAFDVEVRVLRPTGEVRFIRSRGRMVVGQHGQATRLVGTSQDVTELKITEAAMARSLSEKEALLKEVHHRVKNNLQVISSLLSLREVAAESRPVAAALRECRVRVYAMSLIHEQLYGRSDVASISAVDYLRELVRSIWSFHEPPEGLSFDVGGDDVSLSVDEAVPFALVASELISNCFKHAFPEQRGHIEIRCSVAEGERVVLAISDDGVGLGGRRPRRGSLGLELVETLAEQLEGTLTFRGPPGTTVELVFKQARDRGPSDTAPA